MARTITGAAAAEQQIQYMLRQGTDPRKYARGIAEMAGVTRDEVVALIEAIGGTPAQVDPETRAQMNLAAERRAARENPAAYRAAQHEED